MVDVLYLVTMVAFFALMVALVHLCERIVGKDDAVDHDSTTGRDGTGHAVPEEVPA